MASASRPSTPSQHWQADQCNFLTATIEYLHGYPADGRRTNRPCDDELTLLFGFAVDADPGPGYGFETGRCDFRFALDADSVDPLVNTVNGFFYSPEQFGVSLLQGQQHMNVIFEGGLVHPIAAFVTLSRRSRCPRRRGRLELLLLLFQKIFVFRQI